MTQLLANSWDTGRISLLLLGNLLHDQSMMWPFTPCHVMLCHEHVLWWLMAFSPELRSHCCRMRTACLL